MRATTGSSRISTEGPPIFQWHFGAPIPDGVSIIVPSFEPSSTSAGVVVLGDRVDEDSEIPGLSCAQSVEITPAGALVRPWVGGTAPSHGASSAMSERLLFTPTKPWPDVVDSTGAVRSSVVEVGHLP